MFAGAATLWFSPRVNHILIFLNKTVGEESCRYSLLRPVSALLRLPLCCHRLSRQLVTAITAAPAFQSLPMWIAPAAATGRNTCPAPSMSSGPTSMIWTVTATGWPAKADALSGFPSGPLCHLQQCKHDDCADPGVNNGRRYAAPQADADARQYPACDEGAKDVHHDIANQPETTSRNDGAGQSAGDGTDYDQDAVPSIPMFPFPSNWRRCHTSPARILCTAC